MSTAFTLTKSRVTTTRACPGLSCTRRSDAVFGPDQVGEAVLVVGLDDGITAQLEVAARLGQIENEEGAGGVPEKILRLLSRRR